MNAFRFWVLAFVGFSPAALGQIEKKIVKPSTTVQMQQTTPAVQQPARQDSVRRYSARQDPPQRSIKKYDRLYRWADFEGVARRSFLTRFDTTRNYEQVLAERERKRQADRCQPSLERNQAIVRQLRRIDSLLGLEVGERLAVDYRQKRYSVIDSLAVQGNRVAFIRLAFFLQGLSDCPFPTFKLEYYPNLSHLETEGRAVIIGGVIQTVMSLSTGVPTLPPTTSNVKRDAEAYLLKVHDLLKLYFEQLQTTVPQYNTFERGQNLTTDGARLGFRKQFCFNILCEVR